MAEVAWLMLVVLSVVFLAWLWWVDVRVPHEKPKRETHAEMMLRSAAMDHDLWPDQREWKHPIGCRGCSHRPPTIAEIDPAVMRHDSDYEWIADPRLGSAEVHRVRGRLKTHESGPATHGG